MHPYREPQVGPPAADHDDRVLPIAALVVGTLRVALALATGEAWGAEPTIGAFLMTFGAFGVARSR